MPINDLNSICTDRTKSFNTDTTRRCNNQRYV